MVVCPLLKPWHARVAHDQNENIYGYTSPGIRQEIGDHILDDTLMNKPSTIPTLFLQ